MRSGPWTNSRRLLDDFAEDGSSRGSDPCDTVDVIRFMASMGSDPMDEFPTAAILPSVSQPQTFWFISALRIRRGRRSF